MAVEGGVVVGVGGEGGGGVREDGVGVAECCGDGGDGFGGCEVGAERYRGLGNRAWGGVIGGAT